MKIPILFPYLNHSYPPFFFFIEGSNPRASHVLGKSFTTEPPQPSFSPEAAQCYKEIYSGIIKMLHLHMHMCTYPYMYTSSLSLLFIYTNVTMPCTLISSFLFLCVVIDIFWILFQFIKVVFTFFLLWLHSSPFICL